MLFLAKHVKGIKTICNYNLFRTISAKTSSPNTILGFIRAKEYEQILLPERLKFRTKEINFLNDNFFLHGMKRNVFESKYYIEFNCKELKRDKVIIKENEIIDFLYFIKEGEIEISLKCSLFELISKINHLAKVSNFENLEDYDFDFKNINSKYLF